jgi:ABC-2 type transport system permease protein
MNSAAPLRTKPVKDAYRAERTKLRTLGSTFWLLAATVTLTIGVSAAAAAASNYSSDNPSQDTTKLALAGIGLGQSVVAVLAVLAVSNEYSTGMIHTTITAVPRRTRLLAAKAAAVTAAVLPAATVAVAGCLLAGRLILPRGGYTPANGYPLLSLSHGPTLRAVIGSVLYLALIALFSLGVATVIRDTAVSIGVVLGLLYLFPLVGQTINSPAWHRHLEQIGPTTAGLAIRATTNIRALPISPWAGLGVLAAWSAGSLLIGGLLLYLRDA